MLSKLFQVSFNDFKLKEVINPEEFDTNNAELVTKIDEVIDLLNKLETSTTDSDSGADFISLTAIAPLTPTKLQAFLEALITRLQATIDGSSGADLIGSTGISGVTGSTIQAQLESLKTLLDNHKTSGEHDTRYYTKSEIDAELRGGDTIIKVEIFTIVNADNGDGTFTYSNKEGVQSTGSRTADYQEFALQQGTYPINENKIEIIINDTLHRSGVSGGITEINSNTFRLTSPEGNGAELTVKYFEKVGLTGEHALSHQIGGTDEIQGLVKIGGTEGGTLWLKELV